MRLKYVMMDNIGSYANDGFIIFPGFGVHKDVVRKNGGIEHLISAGFVTIKPDREKIVATCYGSSNSLNLGTRDVDSKIITRFINET